MSVRNIRSAKAYRSELQATQKTLTNLHDKVFVNRLPLDESEWITLQVLVQTDLVQADHSLFSLVDDIIRIKPRSLHMIGTGPRF